MSNIPRTEVDRFTRTMEDQLAKHDSERGEEWKEMSPEYLWARMRDQLDTLEDLLVDTEGPDMTSEQFDKIVTKVRGKTADAANFLMFLAEHYDPTARIKASAES